MLSILKIPKPPKISSPKMTPVKLKAPSVSTPKSILSSILKNSGKIQKDASFSGVTKKLDKKALLKKKLGAF